MQNQMNYKPEE